MIAKNRGRVLLVAAMVLVVPALSWGSGFALFEVGGIPHLLEVTPYVWSVTRLDSGATSPKVVLLLAAVLLQ